MRYVFLVLVLAGCGSGVCVTRAGANVITTGDGHEMSCSEVSDIEDSVRSSLSAAGFVRDGDFAEISRGATVIIHSEAPYPMKFSTPCGEAQGCSYGTRPELFIELGAGAETWAHEVLHQQDWRNGVMPWKSAKHTGWSTRGDTSGAWAGIPSDGAEDYLEGSWTGVADASMYALQARRTEEYWKRVGDDLRGKPGAR